jgi:hypothetical protein
MRWRSSIIPKLARHGCEYTKMGSQMMISRLHIAGHRVTHRPPRQETELKMHFVKIR